MEVGLIDQTSFSSLLSVPFERFIPQFKETTGLDSQDRDYRVLLDQLEAAFTETFLMVKGLVLEPELQRLLSLEYDFLLLAHVLKEQRGALGKSHADFRERANISLQELKSALLEGRFLSVGQHLYRVYLEMSESKEAGGREIDDTCTRAYYDEVFEILNRHPNTFLFEYFIRCADMHNIAAVLRLGLREKKRGGLASRLLPHGAIDRDYLEEGLDLGMEGLADLLVFSLLSTALRSVDRGFTTDEQAAAAERCMEQHLIGFLRESRLVIFGIEPLFTYVWLRQNELRNLRTILLGRISGVSAEDIRKHIRG
jgi:V/A-type H+-transporting ATPase subunit C